jgi:acyl dehydratase
MALDPSTVGLSIGAIAHSYTWRDVVLYALGIGARRDELDYLYEGRGPAVIPTFAVVPAMPALMEAMARTGGAFDRIVHGHQKVTVHARIPPSGTLRTKATVVAMYDLKKMAQVIVRTESHDAAGVHLFDTEWGIVVLGEGGWGGEAPPSRDGAPPARDPDFTITETTTPEQALLYRLSGDHNPLHADPDCSLVRERFDGKPILHGLCTYGFAARALARAVAGGDATRITQLSGRFSKPVFPGDTLVLEGWREGNSVRARVRTAERGDAVITHLSAEIAPV